MGRGPGEFKGLRGAVAASEGTAGRRESSATSSKKIASFTRAPNEDSRVSTGALQKGVAKLASHGPGRNVAVVPIEGTIGEELASESRTVSKSDGVCGVTDSRTVPQTSVLEEDFDEPHPHDQHARHNTHSIIVRGGRRREKNDEAGHRRQKQLKSVKRDDFPFPVFSVRYRDPLIELSEDRLTATGYKGWSSVFATHCAEKGKWYYEVTVQEGSSKTLKFLGHPADQQPVVHGHFRAGWACRYQRYDVPAGFNAFGFVIRDTDGSTVCNSTAHEYANVSIGENDVLGAYLSLEEPYWWLPDPRSDHKLYEFIQEGILCNPENPVVSEINKGSWIEFSLNGKRFGKAFKNIWNGGYHPAVALYMGARVTLNLGPDFAFPPPGDFQPACEMARPQIP